jgi:hypothetical protein
VRHQWIKISILIKNGGMKGTDEYSKPLGWIKWYNNDSLQISFPDFYTLEDYALRADTLPK